MADRGVVYRYVTPPQRPSDNLGRTPTTHVFGPAARLQLAAPQMPADNYDYMGTPMNDWGSATALKFGPW